MKRIGITASEEQPFEHINDRRTDDGRINAGCLYIQLSSGELQNRNGSLLTKLLFTLHRSIYQTLSDMFANFMYTDRL